MHHKILAVALTISISLGVVGCGTRSNAGTASVPPTQNTAVSSVPNPSSQPAANQHGYLARVTNGVMFVQLVDDAGHLSGQFQVAQTDSAASISSQNYPFTGSRSGKDVSITLTGSVWTTGWNTKTLTGTLSGSELALVFPNDNGTLGTVVFKDATVDDYNQAITAIRQAAKQQLQAQQAAQAAAKAQQDAVDERDREQRAVASANDDVAAALRTLASDREHVADGLSFDEVFKTDQDTLNHVQGQFADIQQKATHSLTCLDRGQLELKVGQMELDLGQMESENGEAELIKSGVNNQISRANDDIQGLQRAFAQLQAAVQANATGIPAPAYTADNIQAAITATSDKVNATSAALQQALAKTSDFYNQGKAVLEKAHKFMTGVTCSG